MTEFENWGDYFWPGQIDDCLRNRLNVHNADKLTRLERNRTYGRGPEVIAGNVVIEPSFDLDYLQGIHRHLFQDVYEWAGQLRVTELVRPANDPNAPAHEFVKPDAIAAVAEQLVFPQARPHLLAGRSVGEQAEQLAKVYAALNVLHPFVEGNGRTQRIFLGDLAATAGLAVDWSQMPEQNKVMDEAFSAGYQPVLNALRPCLVDRNVSPAAYDVARISSIAHGVPSSAAATEAEPAARPVRRPPTPAQGEGQGG